MLVKLAYFAFASTIGLALISVTTSPQTITLEEALKAKKINATSTSNGKHSGYSVLLNLENTSPRALKIVIPAGTTFLPSDPGEQNLIQLEEHYAVIQPNSSLTKQVAAFCYEANDRCPSSNSEFKIGKNTNDKLTKLTTYLKGKNVSKSTFQDAVWSISNNHSISNISSENQADKDLRKYLATLTGQKNTWYSTPQRVEVDDRGNFNRETTLVSGKIEFSCDPGTQVRQDIYKADGTPFFESDRTMTAKYGKVTYKFNLRVLGWEKGDYYIRIHDGESEIAKYDFTI